MAATKTHRSPRRFGVEHLETRLSLSVSTLIPNNDILTHSTSSSLVSELGTTQQRISLNVGSSTTPAVGDTTINGVTSVSIKDYSNIYRAQVVQEDGRYIVGYVQPTNSYVEYKVYASTAGIYSMATQFAAPTGQATVNLKVNGASAGAYTATETNSWAAYATQNKSVTLAQGWNTIRFESTGVGYNIGSIVITPPAASNVTQTVSSNTPLNMNQYSAITGSRVTGTSTSNYALEYVENNSYIEYTINVQTAGTYALTMDVASPWSSSTVDAKIDGTTKSSLTFGSTGGWQNYVNKSMSLNLTAGTHVLRLQSNNSGYNLKNIVLKSTTSTPTTGTTGNPVSVTTQNMTSFTQLNITGTSGADNITLTQSGNTLTLTANGYTTTYNASSFGNIVVKGGDGNDNITIDGSVKIITLVYGNGGNDNLVNKVANGTIVAIGDGTDNVAGNGSNTSIWVDTGDNASGSSNIHKVASFYGGVSLNLSGQNLTDPSGGKGVTRLNNSSLWGTGPSSADVQQGQLGDCYLLASMQSLADEKPAGLKELAVDLGDGTYAIQFKRNGVTTYVRVDGDLPAGGYYQNGVNYAHPGSSGNQWMAIIEKAYAVFRTGSYSYSSISSGWMSSVFSDFGYQPTSVSTGSASTFYSAISNALNSGKAVTFGTKSSVSGAPLIGNHAYSIVGITMSSTGAVSMVVRNPWGFDGAGNDGNASDAKVTISFSQLASNSVGVVLA